MTRITLAFLGDVMLGRGVNDEIPLHPPEHFWGDVLPVLRGADAVIANLECAVTEQQEQWRRTKKIFHFRARPDAISILLAAGVRAVSLANNHVLDYETAGLLDTLRHLDEGGIARAGAGRNEDEAAQPVLLTVGDLTIGRVALTGNEPTFAATPDAPGTNYLRIDDDAAGIDRLRRDLGQARAAGADLVILSLHWGPNMVTEPPPVFRRFARAAVEAGADIIHGHSAHLYQGVEVYRDRLILYDTGDFLDDYAVDPALRNDRSFVFLVEIEDGAVRRLRLVPVRLHYARVELARGREREAICRTMHARCEPFGTTIRETKAGLEIPVSPDGGA
jgi:poly-gamma-glutamate synthesis protein (capsule biosynthesis protein)